MKSLNFRQFKKRRKANYHNFTEEEIKAAKEVYFKAGGEVTDLDKNPIESTAPELTKANPGTGDYDAVNVNYRPHGYGDFY